ncbi:hypothetical protein CPY51_08675 [Rhizobium tubonense]|uniref:Uncharacterized protein n=1 Tax=Rhizobium tubonense TaxID=484088 RepID=A0A2W4CQW8_9HYPH|nr:hypothetical protein CPY51_08675 [Rhizobium tubonense]
MAPFAFGRVHRLRAVFVPHFMPRRRESQQTMSYGRLLSSLPPVLQHRLLLASSMNFFAFAS